MPSKKRFKWSDLPIEERQRIAVRGAGDCRPFNSPFEEILPCKGCGCWLAEAFRYARHKHLQAAREARRAKLFNHTESDSSAGVPYAMGSPQITEVYLRRLRNHHPEREVREDVA